jgi:hypothetical protein
MYYPRLPNTYTYRDTGIMAMDSVTVSMFGRLQGRYSLLHYMKYTLFHSQSFLLCTLAKQSEIHAICLVPHTLFSRFHRSTLFVWIPLHSCQTFINRCNMWLIMGGYLGISSHPVPKLLELEFCFLKNAPWMPCVVQQSLYDGLSTFKLRCFTTQ